MSTLCDQWQQNLIKNCCVLLSKNLKDTIILIFDSDHILGLLLNSIWTSKYEKIVVCTGLFQNETIFSCELKQ